MRIVFLIMLTFNILIANENVEDINTVKTSELELFLFKIGFQSLLKDVDTTKNKVSLNEEELIKLNSKIEIIMDELYKNKRVLKSDSSSINVDDTTTHKEISKLKEEIFLLKKQIKELSIKKVVKENKKLNKENKTVVKFAKVIREDISVRLAPSPTARVVDTYKIDTLVEIESCNRFGWCKVKSEEKYIARFLLSL